MICSFGAKKVSPKSPEGLYVNREDTIGDTKAHKFSSWSSCNNDESWRICVQCYQPFQFHGYDRYLVAR